jgi:hypothetical protein
MIFLVVAIPASGGAGAAVEHRWHARSVVS